MNGTGHRLTVLMMALAVMAGCSGDEELVPFTLHIVFGGDLGGPRACEESCDAYGMGCAGKLGVRIADGRQTNRTYYFNCIEVPPAADACILGDLDVQFDPLPPGPAHVEVALWPADVLGGSLCLNEPFFDLQGEPLPVVPMPAIAGATYTDIGTTADVYVPMACITPAQLNRPECLESPL